MAFTTPKTWAFQEGVESSELNIHVRDNFLAMGPHLIARKTADQSVTSSTALVNDSHLSMAVGASEVWMIEYRLRIVAGTGGSGGFKVAWTFPTAGEIEFSYVCFDSAFNARSVSISATTSPSATNSSDVGNPSPAVNALHVHGFYVGGGNAGTLQLQFAQYNVNATPTTFKANSTMWGVKLA